MASNTTFFESPQAAAVYKHRLLRTYVPAWAGKVGSRAPGKRVFIYDAYSGPGRYDNQAPGSPELVVDTAIAMARLRTVHSIFSDKEPGYIARLNDLLAEKGVPLDTYEVREGTVETNLDDVISRVGEAPLFVFLDPFGLTVPFDVVVQTLIGRRKSGWSSTLQPKTELLMNFSYDAVRRIAGVLRSDSDHAARGAQIAALDRALGGDWWQGIATSAAEGWVHEILVGFATRVVGAARGFGFITADVADSLSAQPIYELVLFTAHPDGLWEMANAMSFARQDLARLPDQTGRGQEPGPAGHARAGLRRQPRCVDPGDRLERSRPADRPGLRVSPVLPRRSVGQDARSCPRDTSPECAQAARRGRPDPSLLKGQVGREGRSAPLTRK